MALPAVSPALASMPSAFSFDTTTFECRRPDGSPHSHRRPDTSPLTLHEYRKFQHSPILSAYHELDYRRLHRKPSSADLISARDWPTAEDAASPSLAAFAWGPSSNSPAHADSLAPHELLPSLLPPPPTTPQVRPSTASPSLSSTVTTLQSSPTHTPVCRGATACAQPPPDEPVKRARPLSSNRKFPDLQRAKRLPRPAASSQGSTQSGNELWEVYAAVFDPAAAQGGAPGGTTHVTPTSSSGAAEQLQPTIQACSLPRRERYVRFEGLGASTTDFSRESSSGLGIVEEKDPTATSTFSLSRFEFPAPPDQDNWGNTRGILSSPKSPSSQATIHLHGTSFDLVNPHASLLLAVPELETPAEIDHLLDDYFSQGNAETLLSMTDLPGERSVSAPQIEGTPSRRQLYEDADSARRGIMNVREGFATPPLKRTDTNPFRNKLPSGTANRLFAGEVEDRAQRGASTGSDQFDLTLSEGGSQMAMRGEAAQPPASYTESDESFGSHIDLYGYTRSNVAAVSSSEIEQGRGDVSTRADFTTDQTYGNTDDLLALREPIPAPSNEVYPVGTAITYGTPHRASSIYPEIVNGNEDEWVTEYTGSQNDLHAASKRYSIESYADTSTVGADIALPTIPKRRVPQDPQTQDDWLAGSSPLPSKAQQEAQHNRDVQMALSLMNDGVVSPGLGEKIVVPDEDLEQRGESVKALNRLRQENPLAIREASEIVVAKHLEARSLRSATSFDSQGTIKQLPGHRLQKKPNFQKGNPLLKSPLRLGGSTWKGKGRAVEREDSFGSDRQLFDPDSPTPIAGGQPDWSASQSSFLPQDTGHGNHPYNWNPYGDNATQKALQPATLPESTGSMPDARRAALDLGQRPGDNSPAPSRSAMGGQTKLRPLRLLPPPRNQTREGLGVTVTVCTGPTTCMNPHLRARELEDGDYDSRNNEQYDISRKYMWISGYLPFLSLIYGLGGFDWFMRWVTGGRIKTMGKKQKRDALLKIFPLSSLFWAAIITTIVVLRMIADGAISGPNAGDAGNSSPFNGASAD